jgi:hypothetical protein
LHIDRKLTPLVEASAWRSSEVPVPVLVRRACPPPLRPPTSDVTVVRALVHGRLHHLVAILGVWGAGAARGGGKRGRWRRKGFRV